MKQLFLDKTIKFITKYQSYNQEEMEKLLYGLEGIYLTLTKLVFIFVVSLFLGILREVIILLLLFNVIRYTGFGFHAKRSIECLIFSSVCFIIVPYIMMNINFNNIMILTIYSLCLLSYILYAPADTVKRPLPNKKKRKIRKVATVIISIIYLALIFILNNNTMTALILSALINEMIMILPITYKLFKQPYNNYKTYSNG